MWSGREGLDPERQEEWGMSQRGGGRAGAGAGEDSERQWLGRGAGQDPEWQQEAGGAGLDPEQQG